MSKNITTPRTLADCQWTTGYSRASIERTGRIAERIVAWMAGIVVLCWLAMHFAAKYWG